MNITSQSICLAFADDANPGAPLSLDDVALKKLGEIPRAFRALMECYGPRLGDPVLWSGGIHLEINSDGELFDVIDSVANQLSLTAHQLEENAKRQPPLPLSKAVTNAHCIDLVRALSTTHHQSGLTACLHVGGREIELPHPSPSSFTEPRTPTSDIQLLRIEVIGVCAPKADANVVLVRDMTLLELPTSEYDFDVDRLVERIIKSSAAFVGQATLVGKNCRRALAGGHLEAQMCM
ncbi:MAG: hypothetical protein L0H23_00625 [Luteimonas sp.]|nr:hypothetical protein [Luteimonas sp.]